jgi:hypothetical protein
MRSRSRAAIGAVAALALLLIARGSSTGSSAAPCPGGRYLVQGGTLMGGDTDSVLIEDGQVSIGGACLPAQATRLSGSPHGTLRGVLRAASKKPKKFIARLSQMRLATRTVGRWPISYEFAFGDSRCRCAALRTGAGDEACVTVTNPGA